MKSGTTLLRSLLSNHSHLFGGLETHWFEQSFIDFYRDPSSPVIEKLLAFYGMSRADYNAILSIEEKPLNVFTLFMDCNTRRAGKRRWVEKTSGNLNHTKLIRKTWPDARLIHIIRDLRDVYASWKRNKKYDLDTFVRHVNQVEAGLGSLLGTANEWYLELRYESLVADPVRVMGKIIQFVGEEWEDAVAINSKGREEFHTVLNITGKASGTLDSLSKSIFSSSVGSWKKTLTTEEEEKLKILTKSYREKVKL